MLLRILAFASINFGRLLNHLKCQECEISLLERKSEINLSRTPKVFGPMQVNWRSNYRMEKLNGITVSTEGL